MLSPENAHLKRAGCGTAGKGHPLGLVVRSATGIGGTRRYPFLLRLVVVLGFFCTFSLVCFSQSDTQAPPNLPREGSSQSNGNQSAPGAPSGQIQNPRTGQAPAGSKASNYSQSEQTKAPPVVPNKAAATPSLRDWAGLIISEVRFRGVEAQELAPLPNQLQVQPGTALDPEKVRDSLRRLYSSGLYQGIEVEGERTGDRVIIIFAGTPQLFVGRINVTGVSSERLSSQLTLASKLNPGTPYSDAKLQRGHDLIGQMLQEDGFYQSRIFQSVQIDDAHALANVTYVVELRKSARIGNVAVSGDSGMTVQAFRKRAKLKAGRKVNRQTVNRALTNLRKRYQKDQHLEANVNLTSKQYQPPTNLLDYSFDAEQGPIVKVSVEGAKMSKGTIKRLIPVYEEGAVDEDLLNEGNRNLRDYYQRQGYFDVKISHDRKVHTHERSEIVYNVQLGQKHRVEAVTVSGNKYFSDEVLLSRLNVHKASFFNRSGTYSQALVTADVNAISGLYQGNGFSNVKVTPEVIDSPAKENAKIGGFKVNYAVDEGVQQRIGSYSIDGESKVTLTTLTPLLNTAVGQPYSSANVNGDRDAILGYYLSKGFDQAQVNVTQQTDPKNPELVDIRMQITEGDQIFVRNVLISGLHYTRLSTVEKQIRVHSGDPLNQSALLDTQRRLYDLALFNQVNSVVQNPQGDELRKNVLLQFTEAKRWDLNYGFGFQIQTGNPQRNCPSPQTLISLGINPATYTCSPNGKFGASPAVLFDVTRSNFRGTNQSITLRTAYGSLEQRATAVFLNPHWMGLQTFDLSLSGGYINAQDVTTYAASRLEGSIRVTERPDRPNTLIYEFSYRRVKVDPNSIQIAPNLIPLYSQPVRVGGPGLTWVRDTRDNPLDAHRGTFNTVQTFVSHSIFGSQANFARLDMTNSSYYAFGKGKWVLARTTRYGQERAFGSPQYETIPLPEKLYAGGAQSHRGFPINQAGPRDDVTGYPIGGAGVFVNSTEFRLPYPTLPYFGTNLGFVLFHDMGNVFNTSSDIWPSFLRVRQPNVSTCKDISGPPPETDTESSGKCSFNYFSHAVGLGLRYKTPIGPIRVDFAVNLDPPVYPVYYDYNNGQQVPYVGQASHFNFFFSIGQSF